MGNFFISLDPQDQRITLAHIAMAIANLKPRPLSSVVIEMNF